MTQTVCFRQVRKFFVVWKLEMRPFEVLCHSVYKSQLQLYVVQCCSVVKTGHSVCLCQCCGIKTSETCCRLSLPAFVYLLSTLFILIF